MKRFFLLLLLCSFMGSFAFAQSEEEINEDIKIDMEDFKFEMEKLNEHLKDAFDDLNVELKDLKIDLSGLEELNSIDWSDHVEDEEDMEYFNSGQFQRDMEGVQEEVTKALEDVRIDLSELQNLDFSGISKAIEEAMKEVEKEMSKMRREN